MNGLDLIAPVALGRLKNKTYELNNNEKYKKDGIIKGNLFSQKNYEPI